MTWLTTTEAADYLKVKPHTLAKWARQGRVKGYHIGGRKRYVWRFRTADLDAALVESPPPSAPPLVGRHPTCKQEKNPPKTGLFYSQRRG